MYKFIIRPLLFLISPEKVHHIVIFFVRLFWLIPGVKQLVSLCFKYYKNQLETEFVGLKFKNPVGLAAGFDKNASFYNQFADFGFSFIEIGTVTPKGQPGNPKPRSFRLVKDKAVINRMGFNNLGLNEAIKKLQKKRKKGLIIGGNIGKNTATPNNVAVNDYVTVFEGLYAYVDYFVVNVSCPNITNLKELQDQEMLENILFQLIEKRKLHSVKKPILLKISPDLNDKQLDEVIDIFNKTGIDGLVATNTTVSRDNLNTDTKTIEKIGNGGLSGRPVTKRSTEVIKYINDKANGSIPIIGVGGIFNANDAKEKLAAGATLVQVYTGFIYEGPAIVKRILKSLVK